MKAVYRFALKSWLLEAVRRTRADLAGRENVAEAIVEPNMRTAIWILIEQREHIRGRRDGYSVFDDNVAPAAHVDFDATAAFVEECTVCNEVEVGAVRQPNVGASTPGVAKIHAGDQIGIGVDDVYAVGSAHVGTYFTTEVHEDVAAASVQVQNRSV